MIRALGACLRRPELRRIVAVVAVLAFVLVVVLGASHAGEHRASEHDHCGVCVAATTVFAGETLAIAALLERLPAARGVAPSASRSPTRFGLRRSHAPRAPPAVA